MVSKDETKKKDAFQFLNVLEKEDLDYFKYEFRSHSIKWNSIYYNFLLEKVYPSIERLIPQTISPNLITFFGTFSCLLSFTYVFFMYGDMNCESVSSSFFFISIIFWRIFFHCDAVDGIVARTRKKASPLGELLDHGCDIFTLPMMLLHVVVIGAWGGGVCSLLTLSIGCIGRSGLMLNYMSFETARVDFYNEGMLIFSIFFFLFGWIGHETIITPFRIFFYVFFPFAYLMMFLDIYKTVFKKLGFKQSLVTFGKYTYVWAFFYYWSLIEHPIAVDRSRFMIVAFIFNDCFVQLDHLLGHLYGKKFSGFSSIVRWYSIPPILIFILSLLARRMDNYIFERIVLELFTAWAIMIVVFYFYTWWNIIAKTSKYLGTNLIFY